MEVHDFPKGICPKVNVKSRLELKFTYFYSEAQPFNHNTTGTPPNWFEVFLFDIIQNELQDVFKKEIRTLNDVISITISNCSNHLNELK